MTELCLIAIAVMAFIAGRESARLRPTFRVKSVAMVGHDIHIAFQDGRKIRLAKDHWESLN